MAEDFYKILGVSRSATTDEIKKSYRKLAQQLHPDKNPDNPKAEEQFKEVNAAWAVLGDEKKRKLYDEFGIDGLREGFNADAARAYGRGPGGFNFGGGGFEGFGGFGDLDDLLGGLFGGMGGRGKQRVPIKPRDFETETEITFQQALEGCEIQVQGGRVKIPKGVGQGQRLRVPGRGEVKGNAKGDLIIEVHIAIPKGFELEGEADLITDVPLTISQAVLGGEVPVRTPEGTSLKLRVPKGMQSGQKLRARGKGALTKNGTRGDLYVRAMIQVPKSDDPELVTLVQNLDRFYTQG